MGVSLEKMKFCKNMEDIEDRAKFFHDLRSKETLFDYIVTCGVKHSRIGSILTSMQENEEIVTLDSMKKRLKAEISSKFPPIEKEFLPFPNEIINVISFYSINSQ